MTNHASKTTIHPNLVWRILLGGLLMTMLSLISSFGGLGIVVVKAQSPTPSPDRLAEPVLSENPTEYERGNYLYWLNCMPCHGDKGQGLTDEFRSLWPEDHQRCWGRGCHGGRIEDEGFPIPSMIPAVIFQSGNVLKYSDLEELFEYLQSTHPPQNPGNLPDEDYHAIATFVLVENNLLQPEITDHGRILAGVILALICLVIISIILLIRKIRRSSSLSDFN